MNKQSKILVTGGAGYIGSHCILKLIELGYNNIISIDNFSNSSIKSLERIEIHTGFKIRNENIDLKDGHVVRNFFREHADIETIIHFAALKDPFESLKKANEYYDNNICSLINLLKHSHINNLKNFIFSSTCAIYGQPTSIPVNEQHRVDPQNPYASSKLMCENILKDSVENRKLKAISLRYFNPIGANVNSGLKEFYTKKSKNIIPQILRVLKNEQAGLNIYGDQLPTKDGSGVRDYIHVEDLVEAHIKAMEFLDKNSSSFDYDMFNLGTGIGVSVLELLNEFNKLSGKHLPFTVLEKRPNEVAEIYADASRINKEMNWQFKKNLHEMVSDTLKSNHIIS